MIFFKNKTPEWLSREKQQVLKAAFLKGKEAQRAWVFCSRALKADKSFDSECYALLNMVYQNLYANGIQSESMSRLKGAYRKEWYKSQQIIYELLKVLDVFNSLDIKAIFPRDVGLHYYYYKDAFRPIYTVDVFIRSKDAAKSVVSLEKLGWTNVSNGTFKNEHGHVLYLRQELFEWPVFKGHEDEFCVRALSILIKGHKAHVLNPTDQLLYLCVNASYLRMAMFVGDAAKVIESSKNDLEWERFLIVAKENISAEGLRGIFVALDHVLKTPIPKGVLRAICKMR